MATLKSWLEANRDDLKLVASSVPPMFPDHRSERQDKWSGYPEQRREILDFIRDRGIRKTVFLSGDVHCSAGATLASKSDPGCRIHSIISSAFYWPYPAETRRAFLTSGDLAGAPDFEVVDAGGFRNEDNFTRVTHPPTPTCCS